MKAGGWPRLGTQADIWHTIRYNIHDGTSGWASTPRKVRWNQSQGFRTDVDAIAAAGAEARENVFIYGARRTNNCRSGFFRNKSPSGYSAKESHQKKRRLTPVGGAGS